MTVCREDDWPAGYVAVDFVTRVDCAPKDGRTYNAAMLADYRGLEIGSLLTICRDERTPTGWKLTGTKVTSGGICPREPTDHSTGTTAVEIVRVR